MQDKVTISITFMDRFNSANETTQNMNQIVSQPKEILKTCLVKTYVKLLAFLLLFSKPYHAKSQSSVIVHDTVSKKTTLGTGQYPTHVTVTRHAGIHVGLGAVQRTEVEVFTSLTVDALKHRFNKILSHS